MSACVCVSACFFVPSVVAPAMLHTAGVSLSLPPRFSLSAPAASVGCAFACVHVRARACCCSLFTASHSIRLPLRCYLFTAAARVVTFYLCCYVLPQSSLRCCYNHYFIAAALLRPLLRWISKTGVLSMAMGSSFNSYPHCYPCGYCRSGTASSV